MKLRHLLSAAIPCVAAILLVTYWVQREAPAKHDSLTVESLKRPPAETSLTGSEITLEVDNLSPAQLGLRAALIEQREAQEQLKSAEQALARLEEFVTDLERRGEDPADYAEEGLDQFRPAYSNFENARQRLELAESIIEDLRPQLSSAEFKVVQKQIQQHSVATIAE